MNSVLLIIAVLTFLAMLVGGLVLFAIFLFAGTSRLRSHPEAGSCR